MGFSGTISNTWGYGVKENKSELRLHNKRTAFAEELKQRLAAVQIESTDALLLIASRDRDTTFFYCDPPYYNSDMAHYSDYTYVDFRNLLEALSNRLLAKVLFADKKLDFEAKKAKF